MREGLAAFRRADLTSAIAHLQQAVERMPGRAGPRKLLGLIYEAAERYDPSIEQLSAAITLSPADDLMRQTLADVLLLAKRPADAERVLLAAIEAMPKAGGSHYQLARLYQAMGRNGDAIRAARTRRRIPACARPGSSLRHVGCSLFRSDANIDGALAAYRRRVTGESERQRRAPQARPNLPGTEPGRGGGSGIHRRASTRSGKRGRVTPAALRCTSGSVNTRRRRSGLAVP